MLRFFYSGEHYFRHNLKVRVKHAIAIAVAVSFSVLDAPLWTSSVDFRGQLFLAYFLILILFPFVGPLNSLRVLRFRSIANLLGGVLPLASLFLPYAYFGNDPWYLLGSGAISPGTQAIIIGSILTLFSGFGMLVTIPGVWTAAFIQFFCTFSGCPPISFGPGYWLGWAGATVSLVGRSWMPLPKSAENKKRVGATAFSAGVIITISAGLFTSSWFSYLGESFLLGTVFIASGFLLSGIGLILFLGLKSTTLGRIRRALQKPLW